MRPGDEVQSEIFEVADEIIIHDRFDAEVQWMQTSDYVDLGDWE